VQAANREMQARQTLFREGQGVVDLDLTVESESRYADARLAEATALSEYQQALVRWRFASGEMFNDRVVLRETIPQEAIVPLPTEAPVPVAVNWLDRQVTPINLGKWVGLGSVASPPLTTILPKMMKSSQNLYAHLLLLQVGARARAPETLNQTTEDVGLTELQSFLATAGVRHGEVLLEEGSGLSRGALVTPNATVALLRYMHRHRAAETFRNALPIAGVDGTLRNRMKGTAAAGNVNAKTGTLRYVNSLSGYVKTKAGENLVVSLMLNNYAGEGARAALDAIVVMLAESEAAFAGPVGNR
jgi:hypothetical protein